jgi:hypothetical protein
VTSVVGSMIATWMNPTGSGSATSTASNASGNAFMYGSREIDRKKWLV